MSSHRLRDCGKLWSDAKSQLEVEKSLAYELIDMRARLHGRPKGKEIRYVAIGPGMTGGRNEIERTVSLIQRSGFTRKSRWLSKVGSGA